MRVLNTGTQPITINLRDGRSFIAPPGGPAVDLLDSDVSMLEDSAFLIGLFNAGVLVAQTDAGAPFPNFPTTVNSSDASVGRLEPVLVDGGGTLRRPGGRVVGSGGIVARPSFTLQRQYGQRLADEVNDATNGFVYQEIMECPNRKVAIRVPFYNNTTAPFSIDGAWIRSRDTYETGGSFGAWVGLTLGGAGVSTTNLLTVPARAAVDRPGIAWLDFADVASNSLARVDGVPGFVYELRVHLSPGGTFSRSHYDLTEWAASTWAIGRRRRTRRVAVARNSSLDPTTDTALASASNLTHGLLLGWQYRSDKAGFTLSLIGDSNDESSGYSQTPEGGWGWKAVQRLQQAYPGVAFELANFGWGGSNTAQALARARDLLDASSLHRLGIVCFSPMSSNDGVPSTITQQASRRAAAEVAELCQARNLPMILRTPVPNNFLNWTAEQDAFRMAYVNELLAARNAGQVVVDGNGALSNGASPARYITGFTFDQTHPSASGADALAAVATPELVKVLPPSA